MTYEEKISLLDEGDFFALFLRLGAEPRWVTSAGKRAIQIIGLCHHGENHSALFDPDTLKVNCFSECGGGMLFHTWVKRARKLDNPHDAKEEIEDWVDNADIDLSDRIPRDRAAFEYKERPYVPEELAPVSGMPTEVLDELQARFDNSSNTLSRLVWHTEDKIDVNILQKYDVSYWWDKGSIILPHHNINGEIVGMYERSFKPLRKTIKAEHPEMPYQQLVTYPRAKYVPLLRDERYQDEEKTSWSFPNSLNLYGLHLAKEHIKEQKIAIVFEGGKSVMLAHQYGMPIGVATHTFGAHLNHISMLIECCKGDTMEIVLAFDKQYEEEEGQSWELYQRKTKELAAKVGKHAKISRIIDRKGLIRYKDSPIDRGEEIFRQLFDDREELIFTEEEKTEILEKKQQTILVSCEKALAKLPRPSLGKEAEKLAAEVEQGQLFW